jgi:hypothetical protein
VRYLRGLAILAGILGLLGDAQMLAEWLRALLAAS